MSVVMSLLRLVVVGVVAESVMEKEFPKLVRPFARTVGRRGLGDCAGS